ncbi:unnamed protein product, partial [Urochloa humidicola]
SPARGLAPRPRAVGAEEPSGGGDAPSSSALASHGYHFHSGLQGGDVGPSLSSSQRIDAPSCNSLGGQIEPLHGKVKVLVAKSTSSPTESNIKQLLLKSGGGGACKCCRGRTHSSPPCSPRIVSALLLLTLIFAARYIMVIKHLFVTAIHAKLRGKIVCLPVQIQRI